MISTSGGMSPAFSHTGRQILWEYQYMLSQART